MQLEHKSELPSKLSQMLDFFAMSLLEHGMRLRITATRFVLIDVGQEAIVVSLIRYPDYNVLRGPILARTNHATGQTICFQDTGCQARNSTLWGALWRYPQIGKIGKDRRAAEEDCQTRDTPRTLPQTHEKAPQTFDSFRIHPVCNQ